MKRLSILGVMLTAILAMAAMGATSAMASAELPEFLKNVPDTFKGEGTGGKLRTLNKELIECEKYKAEGTVTKASNGEVTITFTGCKGLGFQSNSLGDVAGTIKLSKIPFETCYIKEGAGELLEAGLYLSEIKTHIEVPTTAQLINIEGSLIGSVTPLNKLVKSTEPVKVLFKEGKTEGDPFATECKLGKNTLKASLTTSSDASHVKPFGSALTQHIEIKFTKEHELDG